MSYNPNIPATNDDPADDQPLMQQNFASIFSWTNVDHVQLTNSGTGEHKQVTFNSNNNPGAGTVTPPILFTDFHDGNGNTLPGSLTQLFYYTGAAPKGKNNYVSLANGSCLLFGGIVIKWGSTGAISGTPPPIAFVSPFPTQCFTVFLTLTDPGNPAVNYNVKAISQSDFTMVTSSALKSFYYLAIGN